MLQELTNHLREPETWAALVAVSMAFGQRIRHEVYRRQHGDCAVCGEHFDRLETHHILPHVVGGPDTLDNAIGLCHDDHMFMDRMALRFGILYPDALQFDREIVGLKER